MCSTEAKIDCINEEISSFDHQVTSNTEEISEVIINDEAKTDCNGVLSAPWRNSTPNRGVYSNNDYGNRNNNHRNPGQDQRYQQIIIINTTDPHTRRITDTNGPPPPYYSSSDIIIINDRAMISLFNTIEIRNRFISKVYTILAIQLIFSFGLISLAVFEPGTREAIRRMSLVLLLLSMLTYMFSIVALYCCGDLRRQVPFNYILLSILTLSMTGMMAVCSVYFNTMAVLYAMLTTSLVCILVSLFAIQTKWDVTGCGVFLCIGVVILFIFGFIIMILALSGLQIKVLQIVFAALATFLFCFYLMYDTQQIIGGRRYEISPEEYIHGAIALYIDIMYIFIGIVTLWGLCGSR